MAPRKANTPDEDAIREDEAMYHKGTKLWDEIEEKFESRPRNLHKTPPFSELFRSLFIPLTENKKVNRSKASKLKPHEQRGLIIQQFITHWRNEVGNDFYPALRLIIPEKDRDRAMYGLKEKAIAKLLIKTLKIGAKSDDGLALTEWKMPGQASKTAGDFPSRCHEVLQKRAMRSGVGDMSIAEVNILLDKLSDEQKEEGQLPIFETFYTRMGAEELTWLIRIILRQMKLGASEKTILDKWHPQGEALFSVSSSLRRVCWDLHDPNASSYGEDTRNRVELMACFQPQLAQFQMRTFEQTLHKLGCTAEHPEYWIEEKLDGERMQLHMQEDPNHPGGKRFRFWSRKAKDYTHLYGDGFEDEGSALTRHLKDAFHEGVSEIILDGEMITWDPDTNKMLPFGTLKSAAKSEQMYENGARPLFRVFDCLFLNGNPLVKYELQERRKVLNKTVNDVYQRMEKHHFKEARSVTAIDEELRKIVENASEGLVLKNPRSAYQLNDRNNDWVKVKPEYMTGFGEELDCVIIGGYYGSGHRGGGLSSFLLGLKVSQNYRDTHPGTHPEKCDSFFKVGGGFRAEDYANIKHKLESFWNDWDRNNPPDEYITLGGGARQLERPDVWIKPSDSIVIECKAASVAASDSFATGFTLRFPRFKRLRDDKDWTTALGTDEFLVLKKHAEDEPKRSDEFKVEGRRQVAKRFKKDTVIAGNDQVIRTQYAGPKTQIFAHLDFCVLTDMLKPQKKSKAELEQIIKANGGSIFQNASAKENMVCVGEKRVIKVAALMKNGDTDIVKPVWILDCLKQDFLTPFEPNHMFHLTEASREEVEGNVDIYGDSYTRDCTAEELRNFFDDMILPKRSEFKPRDFVTELQERGKGDIGISKASMFRGTVIRFPVVLNTLDRRLAKHRFIFAGGVVAASDEQEDTTHFVVENNDQQGVVDLRRKIASLGRRRLPRLVSFEWLEDSWKEGTVLDEDRFTNF